MPKSWWNNLQEKQTHMTYTQHSHMQPHKSLLRHSPSFTKRLQDHYQTWSQCCAQHSLGSSEENYSVMCLHHFTHLTFTQICTTISITFDKMKKCFGKLASVCCVQTYPKPLSQKRVGSWKALILQPRATVQWSKHCGYWHLHICRYQTCDSWPTHPSHCVFSAACWREEEESVRSIK